MPKTDIIAVHAEIEEIPGQRADVQDSEEPIEVGSWYWIKDLDEGEDEDFDEDEDDEEEDEDDDE